MEFTNTSQKAYVLEANATGVNTGKNQQFFFLNLEKERAAQNTIRKKLIVDDKETIDQTHILEYIKEFYKLHFYKKLQQKLKVFSVISILQNSLKIKRNFVSKI